MAKAYYSLPMYYGASPKLIALAKQLRAATTDAESRLWNLLTSPPVNKYRFRRQHPMANYIADFYCHQLKLVIEADGGVHLTAEQKQYDTFRDEDMRQFGVTVLRFTNGQIFEETEKVKQEICKAISMKESGC